jgi:hypothetical protein
MKPRSRPSRPRGPLHPSVQALLNACSDAADAEHAVRTKARALVAQARSMGWGGPPFDPFLLAGVLGIKVRASSGELRQEAYIGLDDRGQTEIVWNQDRPASRTRFSIGHEITHTFFPDCFETVRNRECTAGEGPKDDLERLCDVGASELLMPEPEFSDDLARLTVSVEAVDKLRELYEVSREAVCIRSTHLAGDPCAAIFLSYRNKPTEVRSLAQGAFPFLDRPDPKLRVEFMVASNAFPGTTLPKHKSLPGTSRVCGLIDRMQTEPPAVVRSIESWPEVFRRPLAIEAMRIPGAHATEIRVLVILKPAT